jgi:hypothetical protein
MSLDGTALVRQEWEEGHRRLESERGDPGRYRVLLQQVDVIGEELRRRVGQTYSLAELAAAYRDAERWAREAVEERAPSAGWPRDLALVLAAAFHGFERGATDYLA